MDKHRRNIDYVQAYRYGCLLATDPRYRQQVWEKLEKEIRRYWETNYQNQSPSWQEFRDAVRHAWLGARG